MIWVKAELNEVGYSQRVQQRGIRGDHWQSHKEI